MKPRAWQPLLRGRRAAEARTVASEIARSLAALIRTGALRDPSLSKGAAGIALFAGHLARATDSRAAHLLMRAAVQMCLRPSQRHELPSLHLGAPGVAYMLDYLDRHLGIEIDVPFAAIDDNVVRSIHAIDPVEGRIDLLRGLVGLAAYLLPRWPDAIAQVGLERAVDTLAAAAVPDGDGLAWRYHPEHLATELGAAREPAGFVAIGLAEGACGVATLLAHAHLRGFRHPRSLDLIRSAVAFVLSHRLADARHACFPIATEGASAGEFARTSWCLGDLGVAVALWHAARALRDRRLATEAVRVARAAAERAHAETGIVDAGLCHGAAGAAHVLARFYQWTGQRVFATAASTWYARTLGMRAHAFGVAGYASLVGLVWEDEPGMLRGAAGIGLALLAATSRVEPAWDATLLIS
jgi:lantibiotic biosynthesis protein